jgi:hypothetical protein
MNQYVNAVAPVDHAADEVANVRAPELFVIVPFDVVENFVVPVAPMAKRAYPPVEVGSFVNDPEDPGLDVVNPMYNSAFEIAEPPVNLVLRYVAISELVIQIAIF